MNTLSEKEALNKMANYCSRGEHCSFEISEKLKKLDMEPDAIERILQTLKKEKFLDEKRYSLAFVKDKFRFNKWGKLKVARALYQKRIPEDIIREAIDSIDEDEYLETLQKVVQNKKKGIRAKSDYEFNQKLIRSVLSCGYEMSDVLKYIHIDEDE